MKLLKKLSKYIAYLIITLIVIVFLLLLAIDPIAKYAIQKFDTKYLGREITLSDIHINVLHASVEIHDLKLFEKNGKSPFVSFSRFYTQTDYLPLFNNKLNLYPVQFENLYVNLINRKGTFNFDDIIKTIANLSKDEKPKPKTQAKPFEVDISHIAITRGLFSYLDGDKNVRFWLSDYVLRVPNYNTTKDDVSLTLLSKVNSVANISLQLKYNLKQQFYDAAIALKHFPMQSLNPYMKDFLRFKQLNSYLSVHTFIKGNTNNASNFAIKGDLKVNDLELIDVYDQKITSFKELDVNIENLNIAQNIYKVNQILLKDSYFIFEMYPNGNNVNRLFQQMDTTVVVAGNDTITKVNPTASNSSDNVFRYVYDYFKDISKNLILNTYSANKLEIVNGTVVYNDFLVGEKMNLETSQINLKTSRLSSENDSVSANVTSVINNVGKLNVDFTADAKDFKDMIVNIGIDKFPLTAINPYCKYYTGFPFKKGDLSLVSSIKIDDNKLDSKTHLLVEKSKLGKKDKSIRQYNVPLKLVFALLRDKKGNIDVDFPVGGNLDDPNYKLKPVVWKLVKNLLAKTVTAPANLIGGAFKKKDNSTIEIECMYLTPELTEKHQKALKSLKDILIDKPELIAEIEYNTDTVKEKELVVIQEIKKIYATEFLKQDSSKFDSKLDKKIKLTDSSFVNFINQKVEGRIKSETSIIDKSVCIIGKEKITHQYNSIKKQRALELNHFIDMELMDIKARIKVNPITIDKNILNPTYFINLDGVD